MTIERTDNVAACFAIRRAVFIDEQGVPEALELDEHDPVAIHLLARDQTGRPVGTARVVLQGPAGKIGRVAVLREMRGQGLGAALLQAALAELRLVPEVFEARLGAQTHALGFYERLGFAAEGPVFDDAGIPHREMRMTL